MFKNKSLCDKLNNITKKNIIDSKFLKLKTSLFIYLILVLSSINILASCGAKNDSDKNAVENLSKTLKKNKIKNNISGSNLLETDNLNSSDISKIQEPENKNDNLIEKNQNNNFIKQTINKKKKKKKPIIIVNSPNKNLNLQAINQNKNANKSVKNKRINTKSILNRRNFIQLPFNNRQQDIHKNNIKNRKSSINRFNPNFNRFNIFPRVFNNTNQRPTQLQNQYRQSSINNNRQNLNNNSNIYRNQLNNSNTNNQISNNQIQIRNNNNMENINYNNDLELEELNEFLNNNIDDEQQNNDLTKIPKDGLKRYELTKEDIENIEEEKYISKMMLWLTNKKAWVQKDFNTLKDNLILFGEITQKEIDAIDDNYKNIRNELNNMLKDYFKIIKKLKFIDFKTESEFIKIASVYHHICEFISQINRIFVIIKQTERYNDIDIENGSWEMIDGITKDMKPNIKILKNQVKIYDRFVIKNYFKKDMVKIDTEQIKSTEDRIKKIEKNLDLLKIFIDEKYLKNNNGYQQDILPEINSIDRLIHGLILEKQIAKYFSIATFKFNKYVDKRHTFAKYYFKIRKLYAKVISFKKEIEEEINTKLMNEGN